MQLLNKLLLFFILSKRQINTEIYTETGNMVAYGTNYVFQEGNLELMKSFSSAYMSIIRRYEGVIIWNKFCQTWVEHSLDLSLGVKLRKCGMNKISGGFDDIGNHHFVNLL